jgi:hypothetical protein
MPGMFSTTTRLEQRASTKNKALARLHDLERSGEVHRVSNRWGTSPDVLASVMDGLEARTSNLRIIRDRTPVN